MFILDISYVILDSISRAIEWTNGATKITETTGEVWYKDNLTLEDWNDNMLRSAGASMFIDSHIVGKEVASHLATLNYFGTIFTTAVQLVGLAVILDEL